MPDKTLGEAYLDAAHALEELFESMSRTIGVAYEQLIENIGPLMAMLDHENRRTLHRAFVAHNLRRKP